ncbi:helix-turn-helix domain-containing protein [Mesorhizobium sp. B1-1-8]|uniref:helix-turn-helix domain-containing protein n=1 Tax=Mesorhizobium sp. B1-1-8 TaxID=2589976 RepID=UPI001D00359A|nr:helix-turn-helix domain-containing protein [Mesorhizobium sp. B1-1-8]UCI05672.1 helix-turn-helix domain-containing protein [Mesorhizobium sp. B1-1-8]
MRKALVESTRPRVIQARPKPVNENSSHPADQHVGRQIAIVRVQSDVSQAQLARSIGISFQQLQKYENARNRVSASMLYEIGRSLDIPVSRFFEGLPGNETSREPSPLPVDERIDFIASAEGRRLIEGLMNLHPRVRGRVAALIAALGEELAVLDIDRGSATTGELALTARETVGPTGNHASESGVATLK